MDQGGGAEQESGEGAVSCPGTDVFCDPQLSPPIMQEMKKLSLKRRHQCLLERVQTATVSSARR